MNSLKVLKIYSFSPYGVKNRCTLTPLVTELKRKLHSNVRQKEDHSPVLIVSPENALYDVKPTIRVEGLKPLRNCTLKAQMIEDKGKLLYSNAHYIADKNGVVDVSSSPSIGGSYEGIFPTGLLSTLKIARGNYEFGSVYKNDMFQPVKVKISLHDGHQHIESNEEELDSTELNRYLIAEGVQRIPVREGNVRGVLYIPKGEGPFPGVIDMFGATGSISENRAALNASRGIASLCLAYFSYDDIPVSQIHNLDLIYFEEALEYLLSHQKVIPGRCGIIGNCFGGFIGFRMALQFKELKGIFMINASHNPFFCDLKYKGKVVAECKGYKDILIKEIADGIVAPTEEFNKILSTVHPCEIEAFEKTDDDQHFAVAIGDNDCYQFHNGWLKFQEMISYKKRQNFNLKIYPKAGHVLQPPYSAFASDVFAQLWNRESEHKKGNVVRLGGQPKETVLMQEDVWRWIPDFIHTHITKRLD